MSDDSTRPPTVREVAKHANVSRQTVSRVINNSTSVSPQTRNRVLASIRLLGYEPNTLAQSLATRKSQVIGLVLPDITQPFYPQIALGVEDMARKSGYSVFLCHTSGNTALETESLERLRRHRVAGVVNCNSRLDNAALKAAIGNHAPMVLVNSEAADSFGSVIWSGYDHGAWLAVQHLLSIGRRQIAYIGVSPENHIDQTRIRGYRKALNEAGVPASSDLVTHGPNTLRGGYDAIAALRSQRKDIDAVFVFNDLMALGVMRYALTHDIDVPQQLAIAGFGGMEVAGVTTPGLTTIAVPLYTLGTTAVLELIKLMDGHESHHIRINTEPRLIVRGSTVASARDEWVTEDFSDSL